MPLTCIIPSCNIGANEFKLDETWKQTYLCNDHHEMLCKDLFHLMMIRGEDTVDMRDEVKFIITHMSMLLVKYDEKTNLSVKEKINNLVKSGNE